MKPISKSERLALEAEAREQQSASQSETVRGLQERIASLEAENSALRGEKNTILSRERESFAHLQKVRASCKKLFDACESYKAKNAAYRAMIEGQKESAE